MTWVTIGKEVAGFHDDAAEPWCMKCIGLQRQFGEFLAACGL